LNQIEPRTGCANEHLTKKETIKHKTMKTKYLRACILPLAAGGIGLLASGCVIEPGGRIVVRPPVIVAEPAPAVVAAPPPPAVVVEAPVPDYYVWDGYEYVGVVGDQYCYLGPGNVWLVCEPFRLERFHGWERGHPDWRTHATHNDRFRGHGKTRQDQPAEKRNEH
jgi:hypothetical protein